MTSAENAEATLRPRRERETSPLIRASCRLCVFVDCEVPSSMYPYCSYRQTHVICAGQFSESFQFPKSGLGRGVAADNRY
jgi:hypothetical protein